MLIWDFKYGFLKNTIIDEKLPLMRPILLRSIKNKSYQSKTKPESVIKNGD